MQTTIVRNKYKGKQKGKPRDKHHTPKAHKVQVHNTTISTQRWLNTTIMPKK